MPTLAAAHSFNLQSKPAAAQRDSQGGEAAAAAVAALYNRLTN
jgi:hypothetical protein